ncbi:MAG: hypothetical protein D6753_18605 [Planctomycetota bacterium]|nr:MAG: hypothetical protein D6753_18605 [Planctomycetota bacterium]
MHALQGAGWGVCLPDEFVAYVLYAGTRSCALRPEVTFRWGYAAVIDPTQKEPVMSESEQNPYQAPTASAAAGAQGDAPEKVRAVGKAQRLVNFAILLYLLLIPINIFANITMAASNGESIGALIMLLLVGVAALGIVVFILVAVAMLANAMHGPVMAVLYCVAMLIPCVGLILLVVLNARATNYLKKHGVKVGLLGADPRTLP